jgi:glycosyltransferase involved in cell wall biosynthesis
MNLRAVLKMHVVVDGIIFQKDPHGGIARVYRELLPRMCEQSPDLSITLITDGPLRAALPQHPQIQKKALPPIRRTLRPKGALRLALYPFRRVAGRLWNVVRQGWVGSGDGAIWHSTFYTTPARWRGAQVVLVHDMIQERFTQFFNDPMDEVGRDQKRRCIQSATVIACNSETTRQEMENYYGKLKQPQHVIYLAHSETFRRLSADSFSTLDQIHEPFLLYVGSRVHYKNFALLLQAYAGWEQRERVRLLVIGKPWQPEERRRLEDLRIAGQVQLIENVDDELLCQLYNRAVALVYPSLAEGFGIPLLEAMACGCPLVASRIPSTLEVAGDLAFYFEPDDATQLCAALNACLAQGKDPARLAAAERRAAQFSWERSAGAMLAVYQEAQALQQRVILL